MVAEVAEAGASDSGIGLTKGFTRVEERRPKKL
jgi:hypothetical protein